MKTFQHDEAPTCSVCGILHRMSNGLLEECGPYCERCGDCLRCYVEVPCCLDPNGVHTWPVEDD